MTRGVNLVQDVGEILCRGSGGQKSPRSWSNFGFLYA